MYLFLRYISLALPALSIRQFLLILQSTCTRKPVSSTECQPQLMVAAVASLGGAFSAIAAFIGFAAAIFYGYLAYLGVL